MVRLVLLSVMSRRTTMNASAESAEMIAIPPFVGQWAASTGSPSAPLRLNTWIRRNCTVQVIQVTVYRILKMTPTERVLRIAMSTENPENMATNAADIPRMYS